MQSRAIRRLAREMRATHRRTRSWQKTAEIHKITNDQGKVSKGLAYQIALNEFEPREHETLIRLHLPCDCEKCERVKRYIKRLKHMTIFDMSTNDLKAALDNRHELKATHTKKAMNEFIRACKQGRAS